MYYIYIRIHGSSDTLRPPIPCVFIAPVAGISFHQHAGILRMNMCQSARISSVSVSQQQQQYGSHGINLWPWYMVYVICGTCAEHAQYYYFLIRAMFCKCCSATQLKCLYVVISAASKSKLWRPERYSENQILYIVIQ